MSSINDMQQSTPNDVLALPTKTAGERARSYIALALEFFWLLAVFAVPLFIMPPGAMLGYVEIAKVTLFHAIVVVMFALWLLELLLLASRHRLQSEGLRLKVIWARLWNHPMRWVFISLGAYLLVNVVASLLSTSSSVSIWGRSIDRDGYSLYMLMSYAILFAVVATHLRTWAQIKRLMVTIMLAGTVVGAYAILQHFRIDPILGDASSQAGRSESTLGNPIFAGALLIMSMITTLSAGVMLRNRAKSLVPLAAIAASLGIQMLGMVYTFSRGPWVGLVFGLVAFFILLLFFSKRKYLLTAAALVVVSLTLDAGISFLTESIRGPTTSDSQGVPTPTESAPELSAFQRAVSVYPEVAGGGFGGRLQDWKSARQLVKERPWFEGQDYPMPWLRQILGYGPDMFRFVFPLRGDPQATAVFAYEAHNVLIGIAVETGILGLLVILCLMLAVFMNGLRQLLAPQAGNQLSSQRILLFGLLAIFVGRGTEMMVGIPRVADLVVLVVLFAVFVKLPSIKRARDPEIEAVDHLSSQAEGSWTIVRGALAVLVVVILGAFLWVKVVNYGLAAATAKSALTAYDAKEINAALDRMSQATSQAPDVADYYLFLGGMYRRISDETKDPVGQMITATRAYENDSFAADLNPYNPDSQFAAAEAKLNLAKLGVPNVHEESLLQYETMVSLLPHYAVSHIATAFAYLTHNDNDKALQHLDIADSLFEPSEDPGMAASSAFARGVVYRRTNQTQPAIDSLERSLMLSPKGQYAGPIHRHLYELYDSIGNKEKAAEHLSEAIQSQVPTGQQP